MDANRRKLGGKAMKDVWLAELFSAFATEIYRYLAYLVGEPDAEDLLQETFVRACAKLDSFRGDAAPRTWLFAIARRAAYDHLRRRRRGLAIGAISDGGDGQKWLEAVLDHRSEPLERVLVQERYSELWRAVKAVKWEYQEVVILRSVMELSGAEAAAWLGCSEQQVAVRLHRALKAVRRQMAVCDSGVDGEGVLFRVRQSSRRR